MADALGYRAKFGVIGPSTNTIVEPDYYMMAPPGVTLHYSRIYIADQNMADDSRFERLMEQIRASIEVAVRDVMTCEPTAIIMGMSSETFWGGKTGNLAFTERLRTWAGGLHVTTGADACNHALQVFNARRLGIVTPYQPVGDTQVRNYFAECGYDIVELRGLKCPTAVSIAHVGEDDLRAAILDVNNEDVEAIVQCGTNLSMVRLADEAERWLNKPVLAINAVTLWHALRSNGITDQVRGFGTLLREY
jgi:maleate isomerase